MAHPDILEATDQNFEAEILKSTVPVLVAGRTRPAGEPPAEAASIGRGGVVGRYLVVGRLGQGGMGVVYAAYDPELDRRVALKLIRADRAEGGAARLSREARALARL